MYYIYYNNMIFDENYDIKYINRDYPELSKVQKIE